MTDPAVDLSAIRSRATPDALEAAYPHEKAADYTRDVPALLDLVDSLTAERDLARDVAANLEAELAQREQA